MSANTPSRMRRSGAPLHSLQQYGSSVHGRIVILFVITLLAFVYLVFRLVLLQVIRGPYLAAMASEERTRHVVEEPLRGSIFAVDNSYLAVSLYSGSIGFDANRAAKDLADARTGAGVARRIEKSEERLAAILAVPVDRVRDLVSAGLDAAKSGATTRWVPVAANVPLATANLARSAWPPLSYFGIRDRYVRNYAEGEATAAFTGTVDAQAHGQTGLEKGFDSDLRGIAGIQTVEVDRKQRPIAGTARVAAEAADGRDVHTTIDPGVQRLAYEAAQQIFAKYHAKGISIVAVRPATGDILAMVSYPSFDPDPLHRASLSVESMFDRCCSYVYEPGSTLKLVTLTGSLADGTVDPSTSFYCPGEVMVGGKAIHCAPHAGNSAHGAETTCTAFFNSCNVVFAEIGMRMGARRLYDWDSRFGIFDTLDTGLPQRSRGYLTLVRTPDNILYSQARAARVAFGHSVATTPLHMVLAYAAIANSGTLMRPRLVTQVTARDGTVVRAIAPRAAREVVGRGTALEVRGLLRGVVERGTGKSAAIPGYLVAGKTGTAAKYVRGAYVASFCGFLPAGDTSTPQLALLVVVDTPQGAHYGADVAAPAWRMIAERTMSMWHVRPDDPDETQYRAAHRVEETVETARPTRGRRS